MQLRQHLIGVARVGQMQCPLEDDRTGIDAGVEEVNGDPEHLDAVVERLLDDVQARERGQQRRMDVDHPLRERVQERRIEQAHVTGGDDQFHPERLQPVRHRQIAVTPAGKVRQRERALRDTRRAGAVERLRVGPVGPDRDDRDAVAAVHAVDQRLEVGAGSRGQDGDVHGGQASGRSRTDAAADPARPRPVRGPPPPPRGDRRPVRGPPVATGMDPAQPASTAHGALRSIASQKPQ